MPLLLSRMQRANAKVVLYRVKQSSRFGRWSALDTRRVARLCVCCALTESSLYIYANTNVPDSLARYHERVGDDHLSVGLYQQQTPMWGSVESCMDPLQSTDKFVGELLATGLSRVASGVAPWDAIQRVQQSAVSDASNYRRNFPRAAALVERQRWWLL